MTENDGHYAVRGALHEAKLAELVRELQTRLPASMGFTVLMFDYSIGADHGSTFYASTANREETLNLLKEQVKYLEEELPKLNKKS